MTASVDLVLIGKPECHLCDDARAVVRDVVEELASGTEPVRVAVTERSIVGDQELFDRYWEKIPVVLIGDTVHAYWRIDPARLRASLKEAAA